MVEVEAGLLERKTEMKVEEILGTLSNIGVPSELKEGIIVAEVTPNRPDLFPVEGIVRALLLYKGGKAPTYKVKGGGYKMSVGKGVEKIRPFVRCGVVKGVDISDETIKDIMQMQEKLHDTVGRRRKKVAIGIHDLNGIRFPLEYVVGMDGDKFVPLDYQEEMGLDEILDRHPKGVAYSGLARNGKVLIKDAEGVISFPPIINSERTRVSESTKNILLDVTGTSKEAVEGVLNIISASFADGGGEVYSVGIEGKEYPNLAYSEMEYGGETAEKVLGIGLGKKGAKEALEKMGYTLKGGSVHIPPYRMDIISFVDVVEDMAIGYGYDKFMPELPPLPTIGATVGGEAGIHTAMCGMGFLEVKNYVLTNEKMMEGTSDAGRARISNSTSEEFTMVRTSLLPGLLQTCKVNKTKGLPQKFYELGRVWSGKGGRRLCFVIIGNRANFSMAQSVLQSVSGEMGIEIKMEATADARFINGRCYSIIAGGNSIGVIGEIAPQVLEKFELEYPIAACEFET